jgi:6-phosphogluconolactonase
VKIFPDVPKLQDAAADYVRDVLAETAAGSDVRIALSGGSTPRRLHELLAASPGIDWTHVHIYFGDERTVAPDDPQSNYRMARETLLDRVAIPSDNVHRMHGEDPPDEAAEAYEIVLVDTFALRFAELPRFDLIILGMGSDGHTASLFPGTAALDERLRFVVANDVPQLSTTRITLTYPVLNNARRVLFLAAGADKAQAAHDALVDGVRDRPPSGKVRPTDGELWWYLDAAAATQIPRER